MSKRRGPDLNREEALAIAFANLKGAKHKDLLGTAKALQYLRNLPEFRSNRKLGDALGVSGEIVREFLTIVKLPMQIQELFGQGSFKLEHGRRLGQLSRQRPELLDHVAHTMQGLTAMDARHFVDYVLRHPELPVRESRERVLASKTSIEREYHVVAILDEPDFKRLAAHARKKRLPVDAVVTTIVREWLAGRSRHG